MNLSRPQRLRLLVLCLAVGAVAAWLGVLLTGNTWWALAVPGTVAIGWLLVADPTACDPGDHAR